ncbi:MAG: aminotransferase class I/II-fold pyridoxal phosphate-dependent enzyme [Chloroflexota bacterium]
MSLPGSSPRQATRGAAAGLVRMDLTGNPYGPTEHVANALAAGPGDRDPASLAVELEQKVAAFAHVPPRSVLLAPRIDDLVAAWIARSDRDTPVIRFPPGACLPPLPGGRPLVEVHRGPGFLPSLDAETAAELPAGGIAILQSPHDPSGALCPPEDVVRLARACALVIVDQRHGGYSTRTLAPLAREFDNLLVLDTLETWGGLEGYPVGWALGSPRMLERLGGCGPVPSGSLLAGLAVFDDLRNVHLSTRRVGDERSRLYRMLRKLNLVQPMPSWANFLLARVTRGDRDAIVAALAERGIVVHAPEAPALDRCIRVSACRPEHTDALRRALVEISASVE